MTKFDAAARFQHHLDALQQAFRELYPAGDLKIRCGIKLEGHDDRIKRFVSGEEASGALRIVMSATADMDPFGGWISEEAAKKGLLL